MEDAAAEIRSLREAIARHDRLYYREARPEIPDREYDALKERLAALEAARPDLADAASPIRRVGDDRLEAFESYTHRRPMLSLDNTYSRDELFAFGRRLEQRFPDEAPLGYYIEPKIDGVAVSLTYEGGAYARAVSRGNGVEGDVITQNIEHVEGLPRRIEGAPDILEIRGEIFMRHEEFQRLNAERERRGESPYANPRNLAAGTVKLLDPNEARKRRLAIVLYGIGACAPEGMFDTQSGIYRQLADWGFPVLEKTWLAEGIDDAWRCIEKLDDARHAFAYPTDGAVVKLDSLRLQTRAGDTSKAPRWAIAYKFEAERAETRLREIGLQIGRTGAVTPVARLDPVQLAGTVVSRASLHNEDEIRRKDIRPGDTVIVQKAGEIIPQILGVRHDQRPPDSRSFDFGEHLRQLGIDAERDPDEAVWRVKTRDSPVQRRRALEHFAGRDAMDIDHLGGVVIRQLVERGLVRTPADLYKLRHEDLVHLDRFADKSARNLLDSIEDSKNRDLWRLVHGLGIPHVGQKSAQDLEAAFGSMDALAEASLEDLEAVDGVGPIMARSIHAWFQDRRNLDLVEELRERGLNFRAQRSAEAGAQPLAGRTFVLTGSLPNLTRAEATELVENAGGKTTSSVSQKTDYLVAGEDAGAKHAKAVQLGVPVIGEDELKSLAGAS